MSETIKISPKKIDDYDVNSYTGKSSKFNYGGKTYTCRWTGDNQYKHDWKDLNDFINGGVARCGDRATKHCNYSTHYGIAGFRNTCPIAGQCGTYATPATLRLSNFNLKDKNMKGKNKISKVILSFSHKNNGVNVSNGQETSTWGGSFSQVTLVLYKYDGQTKKYSKIATKVSKNKAPVGRYQNCITTFNIDTTINLTNKDNLVLDIIYNKNENTNPCILRLKGLSVSMTYTPVEKPKLSITTTKTAYGDSIKPNTCATNIIHQVKANYNDAAENITIKKQPKDWVLIKTEYNEKTKTFTFKDYSEATGEKTVTYQTTYNEYTTTINGTTNIIEKLTPQIKMVSKYIKSDKQGIDIGSDYQSNIKYLQASGACFSKLSYTIDDDSKKYEIIQKNISTEDFNKSFYRQMSELSCGTHTIHFSVNKNPKIIKHIIITVVPPTYLFEVVSPIPDKDDGYIQNKDPDRIKKYIKIRRIDSEKSNPKITSIFNESWSANKEHGEIKYEDESKIVENSLFTKNDVLFIEVGTHFHGVFNSGFYYSNYCNDNLISSTTSIIYSNHIQYYDELYIRAKNTPYKYKSIVIKKGDTNTFPVVVENIDFEDELKDVVIEVDGGQETLSTFGFGKFKITNNGDNSIKNLFVELNPKIKNDEFEKTDECTNLKWSNEWFGDGIFNDFQKTFFEYNPELEGLIEIINLTPDDDNIDEEDVFINIKELLPNDTIFFYIPFISKKSKEVFVDFYINGVQISRDNEGNGYGPIIKPYEDGSFYMKDCHNVKFIVNDLTDVDVNIHRIKDNDCLDDIDMNCCIYQEEDDDCSCSCCSNLKVRYSITSEDTIKHSSEDIFNATIINSLELNPKSYSKNNGPLRTIVYEDGQYKIKTPNESIIEIEDKITKGTSKEFFNLANQKVTIYTIEDGQIKKYHKYTQKDGVGIFNYEVPKTRVSSLTINELLNNNMFMIVFEGTDEFKESSIGYVNQNKIKTNIILDDDISKSTFCSVIDEEGNLTTQLERSDKLKRNDILIISGILQDSNNNGIENQIVEFITKTTTSKREDILSNIDKKQILENINFNKNGAFNFFVSVNTFLKDSLNEITLNNILNNIFLRYKGNDNYEKVIYESSIKESEITPENLRQKSILNIKNNYIKYKPGSIIPIEFSLMGESNKFENKLDFKFNFNDEEGEEQVAYIDVLYDDICQKKTYICKNCEYQSESEIDECPKCGSLEFEIIEDKKIFSTSIQTNDYKLVPTKKQKKIYCNIPTELDISATAEKTLTEIDDTNIIKINVENGLKPNKDVKVKVRLLSNPCCPLTECSLGNYDLVDVSYITDGTYSYDNSENILTWEVGDMDPYTSEHISIDIKGGHIGDAQISIEAYDYLNKFPEEMKIERTLSMQTLVKSDFCKKDGNNRLQYAYYPNKPIYITSVLFDDDTKQEMRGQFILYEGLPNNPNFNGAFTQYYDEDSSMLVKGNREFYRYATSFADPSQVKREAHTYSLYHYTPIDPTPEGSPIEIRGVFNNKETEDYIYNTNSFINPRPIIIERIPTKLYYKHLNDNFYNIYLKECLYRVNNNKVPTYEENLILNQTIYICIDGEEIEYDTKNLGYIKIQLDGDIEDFNIYFKQTLRYKECSTIEPMRDEND